MTNAAATGPFDVAIAGAGPTALAAALCLARPGLRIALIGPAPPRSDNRTAGLFAGSIQLLRNLKVWDALASGAEPLTAIRIVDDMGGLLRAPEVTLPRPRWACRRWATTSPTPR